MSHISCSILFVSLCFLSVYNNVNAGIAIELPDSNRKHSGHCYATTENLGEMAKGESKTVPGTCIQATCLDDRSVRYYYCPPFAALPPCYVLPADPPLPGCCERLVCPPESNRTVTEVNQNLDEDDVVQD